MVDENFPVFSFFLKSVVKKKDDLSHGPIGHLLQARFLSKINESCTLTQVHYQFTIRFCSNILIKNTLAMKH